MSKRLKQHAPKLRMLWKLNRPKKQRWLKKNLDKDFLLCLCECTLNILNGNIKLLPRQKKMLEEHKESLRQLVNKKVSMRKKHKIVQDGGAFIGALLGPIVSILGDLLAGK